MTKAIGYIRVSTEDQATDGVSLDAQRAKIEAWAIANDYTLTAVHIDAGISGTKADRPGLSKALEAVKTTGAALVVYSLSRLARSTKQTLEIADRLEKAGADLVSLTEKIDTTTAAGKMVFRMLAVLAEFERDQVSERTRAAMVHKKQKRQVYSPIPFGWNRNGDTLELNSDEQKAISDMKRWRADGWTLQAIADELKRRRIEAKKGGGWTPKTVSRIIENDLSGYAVN